MVGRRDDDDDDDDDARDDDGMARRRFGRGDEEYEEEGAEEADVRLVANDLEGSVFAATNAILGPSADLATDDGAAYVDEDAVAALARSSWIALRATFMVLSDPKDFATTTLGIHENHLRDSSILEIFRKEKPRTETMND